jgi:hypothetical protein
VRACARPNRVGRRPLGASFEPHNSLGARASGRRAQEKKLDIPSIVTSVVVSLGGATGIVVAILRKFGNSYIDNQFEKSLENYKFKINSKFDRISKIHEKEFEVLPVIWDKILDANSKLRYINNPYQEYPDVNRMIDVELDAVIDSYGINTIQKDKIKSSSDKLKTFQYFYYLRKFNDSGQSIRDFDHEYHKNRIFLTDEIDNDINAIRSILLEAHSFLSTAILDDSIDYKLVLESYKKQERIDGIIETLSKKIKDRLKFNEVY